MLFRSLTQGSIIEGTDPLTLVAMAGKNDELVVTLVDSEPIPLSDRHLVFHYSHRCLAPGVKGSLNRMFINDDGLKEFIGNSYGSYKKTVSSK